MGRIQKYERQINSIRRFWSNPCDAPFAVYVETAIPAAGKFVFQLLTFGMTDVIRGAFRPKGLGSKRAGHLRKKKGKGVGLPEFGNELGKYAGAKAGTNTSHVSNGLKNLWLTDGAIQRVLFWWMILDLSLGFMVHWQSLIHAERFCDKRATMKAACATGKFWLIDAVAPTPQDNATLWYSRGVTMSPRGAALVPAGRWTMVAGCTGSPTPGVAPVATIWAAKITNFTSGEVSVDFFEPGNPHQKGNGPVAALGVDGPCSIQADFLCNQGFVTVDKSYVMLFGEEENIPVNV